MSTTPPPIPQDAIEFADNPDPRCPCLLLLDTSGSMAGEKITALNAGLQTLRDDLLKDNLAKKRVEIAVVTFNSDVTVLQDFVTADQFNTPSLTPAGQTCMGSGILRALDMVEARKASYRANGVAYYRPWVFLITDGEPQGEGDDVIVRAAQQVRDAEAKNQLSFYVVGVEGANIEKLKSVAPPTRPVMKLTGLNFRELFLWLSASQKRVSAGKPGDMTPLAPTGWGTAAT